MQALPVKELLSRRLIVQSNKANLEKKVDEINWQIIILLKKISGRNLARRRIQS